MSALPAYNTPKKEVLEPLIPVKGGRLKDYPTLLKLSLSNMILFAKRHRELLMHYNLKYEGFNELLLTVEHYLETGSSISVHGIAKRNKLFNKNYQNTMERVNILLEKGLLELVGRTVNNGRLVIPSRKALKELSELCK